MTIQETIKKAIEGGLKEGKAWKFISANSYWVVWLDGNGTETPINTSVYFLDKDFWINLGKALGWEEEDPEVERYCVLEGNCWKKEWHKFIDHLSAGGNAEDFFEKLE